MENQEARFFDKDLYNLDQQLREYLKHPTDRLNQGNLLIKLHHEVLSKVLRVLNQVAKLTTDVQPAPKEYQSNMFNPSLIRMDVPAPAIPPPPPRFRDEWLVVPDFNKKYPFCVLNHVYTMLRNDIGLRVFTKEEGDKVYLKSYEVFIYLGTIPKYKRFRKKLLEIAKKYMSKEDYDKHFNGCCNEGVQAWKGS